MAANDQLRPIADIGHLLQSPRMKHSVSSAAALCAAMLLTLISCSMSYDVDVELRGNRIVFRMDSDWLSRPKSAPVERLMVRQLSTGSSVWEIQSDEYNGRDVVEVTYGVLPSGMTEKIKPASLRTGELYRVELLALGGGGSQQFVILNEPGPASPIKVLHR